MKHAPVVENDTGSLAELCPQDCFLMLEFMFQHLGTR